MKTNKPSKGGNNVDKTTGKQLGGVTGKGFQPGVSGNPNGRPKGTISITTRIKQELQKCAKDSEKSYLDILIERILYKALQEGDKDMIKAIWSYVDGLPKQDVTIDIVTPEMKQAAKEEFELHFLENETLSLPS